MGLICCSAATMAQTLPVGLLDNTDDYLRRQQLLGKDSANSSFMIRPMHHVSDLNLNKTLWTNSKENIALYALPVVWQQQYNTNHPYGMNDGAMILARGYQTLFSAGIAAKIGPLHIQFRPEVLYAENKSFGSILDANNSATIKSLYRSVNNRIDLPERFGTGSYSKLNWGQSSIRLNAGPVSLGLSNENLWWGPGTRSSLLMTNNGPGFKHLTLNTTAPVNTPIGAFEAQLIAGKLEASRKQSFVGATPKSTDWRYLSGVIFTYQPKWIPGLFLGFDRSFIIYRKQMGNGFTDYFPVFSGVTKNNYSVAGGGKDLEDQKPRDQRISLFARWLLTETHAEVYFQYGREDHSKNLRDVFVEPEHSRAYVAGFRKLVSLQQADQYLQIGLEVTKMESSNTGAIRGPVFWYTHTQVLGGYTQQGQMIGVGLDPGSNLQTLEVSWVKKWNKIGLQLEHYEHSGTLYNLELAQIKGEKKSWSDLGITAKYDKEYKRFIFNSQLSYINSNNYQWVQNTTEGNLQLRLGLLYRW